jgi:L-rhamnose mutarotase
MKRYGSVIQVKPDRLDEYVRLHTAVWPEVLAMIHQCNMRNYTIFLRKLPDGHHYLFSYFEYHGSDFDCDMAKMAADPITQRWWSICKPCHEPFADRADGEWWAGMEEICHHE